MSPPFPIMITNKRTATHDALLAAAKRVVGRDGVAKLTLDSVAQEAGVSKGGVLYHFATKNALVAAMMALDIEKWRAGVAACVAAEAESGSLPDAGRHTRAYLMTGEEVCGDETLDPPTEGCEDMSHWFATATDLRAGMIAAIATDHALLHRFRDEFTRWQTLLEDDGIDPATATLIRLAADGLFFVETMGFAPPKGELRQQVIQKLRDLTLAKKTDMPA